MWIMKREFVSKIRLFSDDMSMSEEIKIVAFKFFKSKEINGRYSARRGSAKLKVFEDGFKNLKYLIDYRKKLGYSLIESSTDAEENRIKLKSLESP
jgi:undecaprenyl pyrophosphate synthase